MPPKEILEFILKKENITYPKLAEAMGISRPQPLYDIRDGKIKSISGNYARKIIAAFPNSGYTFEFLLSGNKGSLEEKYPQEEKKNGILSIDAIVERVKKAYRIQKMFCKFICKGDWD